MRTGFVAAGTMLLLAGSPACAGDAAELEILGFSADGSIFAFEEYGTQDGSGFPYANRFYIDTATDRFLPGTPIRVMLDDYEGTEEQARAEARARGQSIVTDDALARGWTVGFNPLTQLDADPHRMVVGRTNTMPPAEEPVEFRIRHLQLAAPERCWDWGDSIGFALYKLELTPGAAVEQLHADTGTVPRSRGCVQSYRLGGVQTFRKSQADPGTFAVLIAVESTGFEGSSDWRWMAVTGKF